MTSPASLLAALRKELDYAPTIERLLDSIARSSSAQDLKHDVIFFAASDIIAAARALVGAFEEGEKPVVSQEAMDWAGEEAKKIDAIGRENTKTRPFSELRADVLAKRATQPAPPSAVIKKWRDRADWLRERGRREHRDPNNYEAGQWDEAANCLESALSPQPARDAGIEAAELAALRIRDKVANCPHTAFREGWTEAANEIAVTIRALKSRPATDPRYERVGAPPPRGPRND